jgi:PAS domain S-box-containing protein
MRATRGDALSSEARLLTDAAPAMIWSADAHGEVTYFNRRWAEYTGIPVGALREAGLAAICHPADYASIKNAWESARETGRTIEIDYRIRSASGSYRWHAARAEAVRSADGAIAGWVGVCTDVDEQKRATAHLQFLSDAGEELSATRDLASTLERVASLAVPAIAEWCSVFLLQPGGGLEAVAFAHEDESKVSLVRGLIERRGLRAGEFTRHAIETGRPALLPDVAPEIVAHSADDPEDREALIALDVRSGIVAPLEVRGRVLGTLQFANSGRARRFDAADLQLAQQLARRSALAIDNVRLLESRQRGIARLRFLADIGESLSESLDLETRLERLVQFVVPAMATWATVNLVAEDGSIETVAVAHRDPAKTDLIERLRGPFYGREFADTGTPEVIRSGRAIVVDRMDDEYIARAIRPETAATVRALGAQTAVIVPLVAHGRLHGTLAAIRATDEPRLSEHDVPLFEEIARRAAVAIDNAQLFARQTAVADRFQKAQLPATLPEVPGLRFAGFYEPGKSEARIGGDWYDAFALADGRVVVSIGDVAGSGLDAAVIMGSVRQVIRGAAQIDADPNVILDATDRALRSEYPDRIVTAFVAVIDAARRQMTFASAGHPPPLLRSPDGSVAELMCVGLPLGLRSVNQPTGQTALERGSMLLFYTDGLIESTRDVAEGERRLHEALGADDILDAPDAARTIFERVLYDGSSDDVAILAIAVDCPGPVAPVVRKRLHTSTASRAHGVLRELLGALARLGATPADRDAAALIFMELVGNAVRHAPGEVEVVFEPRPGGPVLHVLDAGPGFEHQGGRALADPLAESGRGLFLIAHHCVEFQVKRRPGGGSAARVVLGLGREC